MGNFTNMYGTLFYTAFLGHTSFIWKSDGTEHGTIPISESWGKDATSRPLPQFTWLNNNVYFIVRPPDDTGNASYTLMYYNKGAFSPPVPLMLAVELHRHPPYHPEMVRVDDDLYISGRPSYWEGFKILKSSDDTQNYFVPIKDVQDWNVGSNPHEFVQVSDKSLYA